MSGCKGGQRAVVERQCLRRYRRVSAHIEFGLDACVQQKQLQDVFDLAHGGAAENGHLFWAQGPRLRSKLAAQSAFFLQNECGVERIFQSSCKCFPPKTRLQFGEKAVGINHYYSRKASINKPFVAGQKAVWAHKPRFSHLQPCKSGGAACYNNSVLYRVCSASCIFAHSGAKRETFCVPDSFIFVYQPERREEHHAVYICTQQFQRGWTWIRAWLFMKRRWACGRCARHATDAFTLRLPGRTASRPTMLELTWLADRAEAYDLGENEFHLAFTVDDYAAAHALHEEMGCICFENPGHGHLFHRGPGRLLAGDRARQEMTRHACGAGRYAPKSSR